MKRFVRTSSWLALAALLVMIRMKNRHAATVLVDQYFHIPTPLLVWERLVFLSETSQVILTAKVLAYLRREPASSDHRVQVLKRISGGSDLIDGCTHLSVDVSGINDEWRNRSSAIDAYNELNGMPVDPLDRYSSLKKY